MGESLSGVRSASMGPGVTFLLSVCYEIRSFDPVQHAFLVVVGSIAAGTDCSYALDDLHVFPESRPATGNGL
jgi:hypothetical protein